MWIALLCAFALAADERFLTWASRQPVPEAHPEPADTYRFTDQLFGEIAAGMREYPGVVETEMLGHSHEGRPIWAFHVEDPATEPERSVLVFGGIHAIEWIGTEVATDVLLAAIANPTPGVRLTVIPLLNPDGRAKVEGDLLAGRNKFRRGNDKNVDLNRDFAVNTEVRAVWSSIIPGYYAHSKSPLSQPESRALDALARRELYDRAVSLHSFGGFLYYPWAGRFSPPPDKSDFVALGLAMEQAQGAYAYRTRQLSRWGFFFRAQGAELDHLYGQYGTRAFLIEMTRSGVDPRHPLKTWATYFRRYNPEDSVPHRERGVRAVRALIRHPPLPGELAHPAGAPRSAD